MTFKFNELKWVLAHADIVDPTHRELDQVSKLRANYPELNHWGSSALTEAWGFYSQDCWLVSNMDVEERDDWFLGYIYQVEQGHAVNTWHGNTKLAEEGYALFSQLFNVEYFFKRDDQDGSVTLFVESPDTWFGKRTELFVEHGRLLIIIADDEHTELFRTGVLEPVLLDALMTGSNKVVFCNDISDNVFEHTFPALEEFNPSNVNG